MTSVAVRVVERGDVAPAVLRRFARLLARPGTGGGPPLTPDQLSRLRGTARHPRWRATCSPATTPR